MRPTTDRFAYYTQDGRHEHVQVLSFAQALRLTDAGQRIIFRKTAQKAKAAKAVPLKKCHDGVWRMLAEAPKLQSGGRVWPNWEYYINFDKTEEEQKRRDELLRGTGE